MTDHTSDEMLNDIRAASSMRSHKPPRREFYAYFAIIFVATLPLAFVTWTLSAARQMRLPEKDPISKAWSQARIITPMIFTA
ncbi:MAG: cytochrome PufQ [Rhodobacteraceae bacterium]|nr:cytochrome PufQ [Paracoccaceae bacterium]